MNYNEKCSFPMVHDTSSLQLESLLAFAAALGYDAVYPKSDKKNPDPFKVLYFYNPRAERVGQARISVNTMIRKHNTLPNKVFREIQDGAKVGFNDFIRSPKGEDQAIALFAGYVRIVRKVKLTHSRKNGIVVQSHKVHFQTRRDMVQYALIC